MKIVNNQTMYDEKSFKDKKERYNIVDNINDFNKNNIFTIVWIYHAR